MIISGGVNIYPQECENLLITHPKVADAAVFGVPNEDLGEEVKAVVQLMPGVARDPRPRSELIAFCRQHLARQKCPALDRLRGRAAAAADRQALQAPAARPLLGRQEEPDRVKCPNGSKRSRDDFHCFDVGHSGHSRDYASRGGARVRCASLRRRYRLAPRPCRVSIPSSTSIHSGRYCCRACSCWRARRSSLATPSRFRSTSALCAIRAATWCGLRRPGPPRISCWRQQRHCWFISSASCRRALTDGRCRTLKMRSSSTSFSPCST